MIHWVYNRADLKTLDVDYGDVAITLYGGRRAYLFNEDDIWVRDKKTEKKIKKALEKVDKAWIDAPGNVNSELTYYPPAK